MDVCVGEIVAWVFIFSTLCNWNSISLAWHLRFFLLWLDKVVFVLGSAECVFCADENQPNRKYDNKRITQHRFYVLVTMPRLTLIRRKKKHAELSRIGKILSHHTFQLLARLPNKQQKKSQANFLVLLFAHRNISFHKFSITIITHFQSYLLVETSPRILL